MSEKCYNCLYVKDKLTDLIQHYEELLATKDQQIVCSHKIIHELEQKLRILNEKLSHNGLAVHQLQQKLLKTSNSQEETIEYLKQRQVKLIEQLKNSERQIFRLVKEKEDNESMNWETTERNSESHPYITPKKKSILSPIKSHHQNITLGKQNSEISKLLMDTTAYQNRSSQGLKLKVTEDQLKVMEIKHKIALLKCFQIASLK